MQKPQLGFSFIYINKSFQYLPIEEGTENKLARWLPTSWVGTERTRDSITRKRSRLELTHAHLLTASEIARLLNVSTRQSRLIYDRCLKYESEHDKYRCNPYRIKLKTLLIVENIDINYLMDMVINEEKVNKNVIPKTEGHQTI